MVKVIAPMSQPANQKQPPLFGPAICSPCDRETIPIGPSTYPRRCPRCGNRWHTVLSREQNLLSLSNIELVPRNGGKDSRASVVVENSSDKPVYLETVLSPVDNNQNFLASRVIKYFPDGSGYSVHYREWGQMTVIYGPPRLIQEDTPGNTPPPAE